MLNEDDKGSNKLSNHFERGGSKDPSHIYDRISSKTYSLDSHSSYKASEWEIRSKNGVESIRHKSSYTKAHAHSQISCSKENECAIKVLPYTTLALAFDKRAKFTERFSHPKKSNSGLHLKCFSLLRTIGRGSFGRVILVHHKTLDKFMALKVLCKEKLVRNKQIGQTINERNILQACHHPNIVRYFGSFQDNSYVYFVMDLYCNSDLYQFLKTCRKGISESHAKFYAANVFLALEYLHLNQVIFRDLKPENVLMASNGYLKLTDFGFAKFLDHHQLTKTICGTPDYLSPEVLSQKPYGKSVDWWAFGVFVYEINSGKPPFSGPNQKELFNTIVKGRFAIPKLFSPELADLCKRLLELDPKKRLGCLKQQSNDVRDHRWFRKVDWMSIYEQTARPPYLPKLHDPVEIAFKETKKPEEPLRVARVDPYQALFANF